MPLHADPRRKEAARGRLRRLRLDQLQSIRVLDYDIDLYTVPISIERQPARLAPIRPPLQDLRHHPGLEDRATKRMRSELTRLPNPEQPTHEA